MDTMRFTIDPELEPTAQALSDAVQTNLYNSHSGGTTALPGWRESEGAGYDFASDSSLLAVFTSGSKHMKGTEWAQSILEDWRCDRDDAKEYDKLSTKEFIEEMGYFDGFTGGNLTQLLSYYLSPRSAAEGTWLHAGSWTSDDGVFTAHYFVPLGFREHDGFLWLQENATGHAIAIPHDEL